MVYAIRFWITYESGTETVQGRTLTVHGRPLEHAACEWNGQHFEVTHTKSGVICPLARLLLRAEAPDAPWVVIDAETGQTRLEGNSLHRMAALTVKEGKNGPRFVRWKPHPMAREA